jgi:hypothetical protein
MCSHASIRLQADDGTCLLLVQVQRLGAEGKMIASFAVTLSQKDLSVSSYSEGWVLFFSEGTQAAA